MYCTVWLKPSSSIFNNFHSLPSQLSWTTPSHAPSHPVPPTNRHCSNMFPIPGTLFNPANTSTSRKNVPVPVIFPIPPTRSHPTKIPLIPPARSHPAKIFPARHHVPSGQNVLAPPTLLNAASTFPSRKNVPIRPTLFNPSSTPILQNVPTVRNLCTYHSVPDITIKAQNFLHLTPTRTPSHPILFRPVPSRPSSYTTSSQLFPSIQSLLAPSLIPSPFQSV